MSVYEYVDEDSKVDENSLTVDFYFESDIDQDEAIKIIDDMVSNTNDYSKLIGHKPTIYVKSPFNA